MLERPAKGEYNVYYTSYVDLVPEGVLLPLLLEQLEETTAKFSSLTEEQQDRRYAPGKYTVKEVLGHIIDTERIMSYRLLRIARGDQTPLAGYDDEAYVAAGAFATRPMKDMVEEFRAVRLSTVALLKGVPDHAWSRSGIANDSEITARALAYIIAGHERHHLRVLAERYGV
ncbi:DinB family protein [Brevibacillus sp. GCM10020057]|uniref:DinB family protein n=1 Tax=Brevibacillus sp. GCM10020057 TaxID=3317327 RepID=UPI00363CDA5D